MDFAQQLNALPHQLLLHDVIARWGPTEKKTLRGICKLLRTLVNSLVKAVKLPAGVVGAHGVTLERLGHDYPQLEELTLVDSKGVPFTDEALTALLQAAAAASDGSALLARLVSLDVKTCHFLKRAGVASLAKALTGLQRIRLSRWADAGQLYELRHLAHLTHLDLGDADVDILTVDDKCLAYLAGLKQLTSLSLQRCRQVTPVGLAHAARLPRLTHLDLTATRTASLEPLVPLGPRLRSLVVRACRDLGNSGFAHVCALTCLTSLAVGETAVCRPGLVHLASLPSLARLDLGQQWELNDGMLALLAGCSSLEQLRVGNFNLSSPLDPPGALACLSELIFGGMFTNRGLHQLLPLPALRVAHVQGLDAVKDTVMGQLARQTTLEELNISGGSHLTPDGLMSLAAMPALRTLRIVACPAANEPATLQRLLSASASLARIEVTAAKAPAGAPPEHVTVLERRR